MMPEIPEELVEEILCRVPATSLKRLRSTCKRWNRLFNDTNFSRKHFDKAAKQFPVVVITLERTLCSLCVNLHDGKPSPEITGELSLIQVSINHDGKPSPEVTVELSLNQVRIDEVFHCDGLLICTIRVNRSSILVWNPCTGQTKWIRTPESRCCQIGRKFVLGNYQDNKSCNKSYKILRYKVCNCAYQEFDICDISFSSWRRLDVTPIPNFISSISPVSLKGKTYWFVWLSPVGLISFDYTTERFERLRLPYQCNTFKNYSLSVVGEEKLSVLLHQANSSRSEVWITDKIDDDTKEMSWSKLLEVGVGTGHAMWFGGRFLVDEEKKIVVYCKRAYNKPVTTICIVRADSNATREYFPDKTMPLSWPYLMYYVPSLIQIQ